MSDTIDHTEPELLKALADGSAEAFDKLYIKYYEAVRGNIMKILHDETVADDILQEVFISLWQKRGRFADYGRISGWLFVASYNRSITYLRRQATERLNRPLLAPPAGSEDPEEEYRQEELLLLLEQAIQQLPPQRRRVFELCRLKGYTYDQAATELSISRHTVKDHLGKATDAIRDYFLVRSGKTPAIAGFVLLCFDHLPQKIF